MISSKDLSNEAQQLKVAAEDAIRTMKRSAKRGLENLTDLKDESLRQVKRHPAQAVAIAMGAGIVIGLTIGWLSARRRREASA